jgi:hypothetical protein
MSGGPEQSTGGDGGGEHDRIAAAEDDAPNASSTITSSHLSQLAIMYLRQATLAQALLGLERHMPEVELHFLLGRLDRRSWPQEPAVSCADR